MSAPQSVAVGSSRPPSVEWKFKSSSIVPAPVQSALREAMRLEATTPAAFDDLLWIIAQNPRGEKSFGDAVEECQGGIRYVYKRYRAAAAARLFWQKHHWY